MKNDFNTDVFEFGNDNNTSGLEQSSNDFNYDSISGLGQSDYENEDLFQNNSDVVTLNEQPKEFDLEISNVPTEIHSNNIEQTVENNTLSGDIDEYKVNDDIQTMESSIAQEPVIEELNNIDNDVEEIDAKEHEEVATDKFNYSDTDNEESSKIELSKTPIEELNKLTEYEEDKIETTDINSLFNKVNVNVKEASDIFKKNTEMKQKIDSRFEELKQLQSEIEKSKQSQLDEINAYKDEVLNKLTDKKAEIEKRLNTLKELQASLEKDKKDFEEHKKQEQEKIDKIQKEVQTAYDDRREELGHIEDVLRKQKDSLDEERNQLSLDKIQYESDKNELANNLLKFNELVDSFTNGMSGIKEND